MKILGPMLLIVGALFGAYDLIFNHDDVIGGLVVLVIFVTFACVTEWHLRRRR